MAILESLPEVEEQILVDGIVAVEYDENADDLLKEIPPMTVVKYIQCISDAHFALQYQVDPKFKFEKSHDGLLFKIYVDGEICDGTVVSSSQANRTTSWKCTIRGAAHRDIKDYIQKFKFDFVSTVETDLHDPKIDEDRELTKDWGKIKVEVSHCTRRAFRFGDSSCRPRSSKNHEDIAAKGLKGRALSHGTCFGEIEVAPVLTWLDLDTLEDAADPIATFVFNYASKKALHIMRVINTKQYTALLTPDEKYQELRRLHDGDGDGPTTDTRGSVLCSSTTKKDEPNLPPRFIVLADSESEDGKPPAKRRKWTETSKEEFEKGLKNGTESD